MLDGKALKQSLADPRHKGFVGQTFARYEILSTISRGGVGIVLRAKHKELGQLVALKLLLQDDPSPEALGRFRREAKVLAQVRHPNVVGVTDVGDENGVPYIAMELVEGRDLHQVVRGPGGRVPDVDQTTEVVTQLARALAHCHEQGVIHRDVKPKNVLLEHGTGRAVLTDFGLVKRDPSAAMGAADGQSQLSVAGQILGTPSFMAPEQFEPDGPFGSVEARTDVWGLGATLYFLLTGRPPFEATSLVDLYHEVTKVAPPRPASLRPSIPEVLDDLCMWCLNKKAADRPTMAELILRLEALEGRAHRSGGRRSVVHVLALSLLFAGAALADLAAHPERAARARRLLGAPPPGVPGGDGAPTPGAGPSLPAAGAPSGPAAAGPFAAALARAEGGQRDAMLEVALMLKDGRETAKDPAAAVAWFERAAAAGDVAGMFWLGVSASQGAGLPKDAAVAEAWFLRAAEGGHSNAMLWLGTLLAQRDPARARTWLEQARATTTDAAIQKKAADVLARLAE